MSRIGAASSGTRVWASFSAANEPAAALMAVAAGSSAAWSAKMRMIPSWARPVPRLIWTRAIGSATKISARTIAPRSLYCSTISRRARSSAFLIAGSP